MRVGLCLPSRGECKAGFTYDLARLTYASGKAGLDLTFSRKRGTLIHDVRIGLAETALAHDPEYLLWLDDDMRFPPDALARLLAHEKAIVGCNYPTKSKHNSKPTARRLTPEKLWESVYTAPLSEGLEEVDALGFGLILTHTEVFANLDAPWFSMPYAPQLNGHVGEDVYFCVNAKMKGFPTFLDHDLSKEVRHDGDYEYTWDEINRLR